MRGILPGVGPFISKDRVVPLDVSRVRGDVLRVRIRPPAGFWALNSFAVDYSADQPVSVQRLRATSARDSLGKDVLPELLADDDRYLPMPNIGDTADLTFSAPAHLDGMDRSVFLHSRGYYRLHINGTGAPDTKTLLEIENVPGAGVRFAANHFAQWQIAQTANPPATPER